MKTTLRIPDELFWRIRARMTERQLNSDTAVYIEALERWVRDQPWALGEAIRAGKTLAMTGKDLGIVAANKENKVDSPALKRYDFDHISEATSRISQAKLELEAALAALSADTEESGGEPRAEDSEHFDRRMEEKADSAEQLYRESVEDAEKSGAIPEVSKRDGKRGHRKVSGG